MKKKKRAKAKISKKNITPDLPQNIIPVGERVFDDKNIYINQKVYAQIHKFASNKTENEHGGILVGRVLNEMGKENTIIEGFIEAKYNNATPTTLTFTHETWDYFHSEMERKYKDKKIVGWIHTHPNFGIFLSENDKFIQENFFTDVNQVAYVVDPIQLDEGFFFWVDEKLERCPGFYLFDKNGVKIKQKPWSKDESDEEFEVSGGTKSGKLLMAALTIVLIANLIVSVFQTMKINDLERQIQDHKLVIEYGIYGGYGAPDVSAIANSIRMELEMQKKSAGQMLQDVKEQEDTATDDAQKPQENEEKKEDNKTDTKENDRGEK